MKITWEEVMEAIRSDISKFFSIQSLLTLFAIFIICLILIRRNKNIARSFVSVFDTKVMSRRYIHMEYSIVYYATFEFPNGGRVELTVPKNEYGVLAEGDIGKLTYYTKNKKFVSFIR